MASTQQELFDSLEIFNNRSTINQILASEVRDEFYLVIDSMVQLMKHRDSLSLFVYHELRSLPYQTNEIVFYQDKFYRALQDNIQGAFNTDLWQPIDIMSAEDTSFTRTITDVDFAVGEMVYHSGTGYKKAVAGAGAFEDDTFALFVVKKVVDNAVEGDQVTFGTTGAIVEMNFPYPDATPLYLSADEPGAVSELKPLTSPFQQVGYYADGILHFNPVPIAIDEVLDEEEDTVPTSEIINHTEDFSSEVNSVNTYYRFDSLSEGFCTVVPGALSVGETAFFRQVGDGVLSFIAGTGVTLIPNLSGELKSVGKGDTVSFIAVDTNVYEMI